MFRIALNGMRLMTESRSGNRSTGVALYQRPSYIAGVGSRIHSLAPNDDGLLSLSLR